MTRAMVAEPLAKLRRRRALTQRALAQLAGVAPTTIELLEVGKAPRPTLTTVSKIARALAVDPADVQEFRASIGLEDDEQA